MFRPENVRTSLAAAQELNDLTGLDIFDLVALRPERLALHELLIRVTADLLGAERVARRGPGHQLPRNGRHAARESHRGADAGDRRRLRRTSPAAGCRHRNRTRGANAFGNARQRPRTRDTRNGGWVRRLFGAARRSSPGEVDAAPARGPDDAIAAWRNVAPALSGEDRLRAAAFRALAKVVGVARWPARRHVGDTRSDRDHRDRPRVQRLLAARKSGG